LYMEITFLTRRSDLAIYYDYYIKNTTEGKKYSESILGSHIFLITIVWFILYIFTVDMNNRLGIWISAGYLFITIIIYYGFNKFNPRFYAAKRKLIMGEKKLPTRHWQILERTRTAIISKEWLEIITADSLQRFHWNLVDKIVVQPDNIILIISNVVIVPRRDFPSDENYQEFGKLIMDYWEKGKDLPITRDL
jgi:hypothetical protein